MAALTGAVNAGTIAAHLRLDSTVDKDASKAKKSLKSVTGALTKVTVAAGAAALALTAALGVKIIKAGSDVEEMMGKFDAVFRENADSVEEWADSFGDDVGRSKFELMGFASTLQDTFVPMGFARDEGAELSKQLTELAIDLASFNNEAEPETIAALQSALVGNHETMRQYGVIITQTTLSQELMNMGIASGVKSATEQQKVQARMNIIMAGTSDAQGDAARTAGSLANMQRKLKSTMSEMMGEAGRDELPEMTKVLEDFDAWGQAGGYEDVQGFFSDVAAAATLAAKGISEVVQASTTIYSFYADIIEDSQDQMRTQQAEFARAMLESGKVLDDQQRAILETQAAYGESVHPILELRTSYIDLSNVSGNAAEDIVADAKSVQAAFSDVDIPDWAGRGYAVAPDIGMAGSPITAGAGITAPTITAGAPTATGGSIAMLNTINTSIKDGNKEVVAAINRISLGGGGGGIGARGNGSTGRGAELPPNVHANMKKTYDLSGLSSLRF